MKTKATPYKVSKLTQKTFIIIGLAAYVLQVFGLVMSLLSSNGALMGMSPYLLYMIDSVIFPILLFSLGYWLAKRTDPRLWRVFIAMLAAFIGVVVQSVLNQAYFQFVQISFIYDVPSLNQLVQLAPSAVTLAVLGGVGVYFRRRLIGRPGFLAPTLQNAFSMSMLISVFVLIGLGMYPAVGQVVASGGVDVGFVMMDLVLPIVVFAVLFFSIYLTASKKMPRPTRIFVSTLYGVIGIFVAMSVWSLMTLLYLNTSDAGMSLSQNIITMALGLIIYASIVVWHKRQKAF